MTAHSAGALLARLSSITRLPARLVVGLSSGTSHDGVDAALVRVGGHGAGTRAELVAFRCFPFEAGVRGRIAAAPTSTTPELARLHFDLGRIFADAALGLLDQAGVSVEDVHLIGSHGQTVFHDPPGDGRAGATLQIGEADVVAAATGTLTVSDFRTADVASGGSGAPLIPLVDWLLFRDPGRARLMLNVGGIANVTYVVDDLDGVVAFDTGPGNSLIDALVSEASGGREAYDAGGAHALSGSPHRRAVDVFLRGAYFSAPPPKSTGRELFGAEAAHELAALVHPGRPVSDLAPGEVNDLLATATAVTAESVVAAARLLPEAPALSGVVVSGGGARNEALLRMLEAGFGDCPVLTLFDLGMDPDAKEAVGFAVLANEAVFGEPGNLPRATGAARRAVLGKLSPGL